MLAGTLSTLDPEVMAGMFKEYPDFYPGIMTHLDRELIAGLILKGFEAGAFEGIVTVMDVQIPGLDIFGNCRVRLKGAECEVS